MNSAYSIHALFCLRWLYVKLKFYPQGGNDIKYCINKCFEFNGGMDMTE